ncbi:MAG: DUF61 family protein [Methanomicrobiales archaeon]|nr:DUF61 family protein [Methanomicrobiales archaeon]
MTDDAVFLRWMRTELGRINRGIVSERKTLEDLLQEVKPASRTRGGEEHLYRRDVLQRLGEALPKDLHGRLRLPILFYFDTEVSDSAYLTDRTAAQALQELGELSPLRTFRDGRLWVSRAIVYAILQKYPTAVQTVMM